MKNMSASIKQKLLNKSKIDQKPFGELLQYYAMERFLYRISNSKYSEHLVLKGALMLRVWQIPFARPTKDIDVLGLFGNTENDVKAIFQEIILAEIQPDGLVFDAESINISKITKDADYHGMRVKFLGYLGSARINMQIDIGFGDLVHPKPIKESIPVILDLPPPSLFCYSRESVIAEKFEAMVSLGHLNSRMKDFYDIWYLSKHFNFDQISLFEAIRKTFDHRKTTISLPIEAFSQEFAESHQGLWVAFCKRILPKEDLQPLKVVINEIIIFLTPFIDNNINQSQWSPRNRWDK